MTVYTYNTVNPMSVLGAMSKQVIALLKIALSLLSVDLHVMFVAIPVFNHGERFLKLTLVKPNK